MKRDNYTELKIGDFNTLELVRFVDFGAYLESDDGDILLPKSKIPPNTMLGEMLDVFIYKDSENRLIATTTKPKIFINQCAFLEVMDVNKYGAFLDWGIENQLLVPYREQTTEMKTGLKYLVYLYLDKVSDRLVATMRIEKHLSKDTSSLSVKEKVDLHIYQKTPIGYKAIINQINIGLLYDSELMKEIHIGDHITGYIKTIREDGKIDLSLQPIGFDRLYSVSDIIMRELLKHNGFLPLNDKSSPENIKKRLNISKSDFKKTVGMLFKQKKIKLLKDGIAVNNEVDPLNKIC
ncbi:MAG: S1-like domain-containing RNA-binding protein [Spirochaetia bacterium]|nr:S1-like domain-containing RNA-binding protein [Spirochaetia bacterium]